MQPLHDGLEYRAFTYPYIGENTGVFGIQSYSTNYDQGYGGGYTYGNDYNYGGNDYTGFGGIQPDNGGYNYGYDTGYGNDFGGGYTYDNGFGNNFGLWGGGMTLG